jgi:hypothetical protein
MGIAFMSAAFGRIPGTPMKLAVMAGSIRPGPRLGAGYRPPRH